MHRISKFILLALVIVAGLLAVGFIGANLYLQSSEVQTRIRLGVQQAIGAPLEVRGTSLTPWAGLTLSGLAVNDPTQPETRIFEAKSVNARLNWWRLMQRRIEITSVTMNSPIVVIQSGRTALVLPSPRQDIPEIEIPLPSATPSLSPMATPAPEPTAAPAVEDEPKSLRIAVRHFGIRDGLFILKDRNGQTQIEVQGVEMDTLVSSESEAKGTLRAAQIILARQFPVHHASADYTLNGDQLDIPRITAEFGSGKLEGSAKSHLPSNQSSLSATLKNASVKAVLNDASLPSEGASGDFSGVFDIAGVLGQDETYTGQGQFELVSGTLKPLEFIQKMGQLFQIEELQLLELETAQLKIRIGGRRTLIEELTLQSKNLILSASGPVKFDGRLNLDAYLKINPKLQRNLQNLGLLNRNFKESDLPGYRQVAFKVGGTLSHPTSDLLDKLTGIKLGNDLGNLIQGLFNPPKKKEP